MSDRVRLFSVEIDALEMQAAVERILTWLDQKDEPCRLVVTPNVHHAVMLQQNEQLRAVYRDAQLVLADGLPIVLASRLVKRPLPERVAGSELVPLLFQAVDSARGLRVFLLGAGPGVAERAAHRIEATYDGVQVVGTLSPPYGFESDADETARVLSQLRAADPELIVVGLGAPKQEIWVHQHRRDLPGKVVLCVGATIDFMAGEKPQAPVWMRRAGLEWFYRVATEPRRLTKRYARDAYSFPGLVWRELRSQASPGPPR